MLLTRNLLASIITLTSMLIADFTRNHLARVSREELSNKDRTEKKVAKQPVINLLADINAVYLGELHTRSLKKYKRTRSL